jgi:hypothetical protein
VVDYEKQVRAIKKEILKICWYMRGGLTYDEAIMLGIEERNIIGKIVEDNMETTKNSGLPFF